MVDQPPNAGFQFVNATLTNPQAPQDKAVRTLIRKQAMKQASATRRKLGNYGKHNVRQCPIFCEVITQKSVAGRPHNKTIYEDEESYRREDEDELLRDGEDSALSHNSLHLAGSNVQPFNMFAYKSSLPPSLSRQGYEAVVAAYDLDVVNLSAVALLRLGRSACMMLSADTSTLASLLRCNWASYLTYAPSRYAHSPCLSDAIDCILARVRQILFPAETKFNSIVLPRYIKALKSLQEALYSSSQCYEADVLCAIEILALYELLNPSSTAAWSRHTAGAARLIQLRGPESYKTDFEKSLLIAHAGPIMTEAMLENERCFLEEEPWRLLLESLILENHGLLHQSETAMTILILKSRVPGIFKDTTAVICNNNQLDFLKLRALFGAHELLADLGSWLCFHSHEMRSDIMSTYLSCRMIVTRLLAALSTEELASMEEEAQQLASQTFELERVTTAVSPFASLLLAQAVAVAHSIRSTAEEWKINLSMDGNRDRGTNLIIERWKFEHWCRLLGRKVS